MRDGLSSASNNVDEIMEKIRIKSWRAARLLEFFRDFDRHRNGRVTHSQYIRALNTAGMVLSRMICALSRLTPSTLPMSTTENFATLSTKSLRQRMEKAPLSKPKDHGITGRARYGNASRSRRRSGSVGW